MSTLGSSEESSANFYTPSIEESDDSIEDSMPNAQMQMKLKISKIKDAVKKRAETISAPQKKVYGDALYKKVLRLFRKFIKIKLDPQFRTLPKLNTPKAI